MPTSTRQTTSLPTALVPKLPDLPTPFNNKIFFNSSLYDYKPTTMSSHQASQSDRKQSKASDASSILSTSTTSSMSALLKSKFIPKSKAAKAEKEQLSPGEKQAIRRQDRMSYQTLATIASMK